MYVRPAARGAGIGRRLVEVILEHARGGVELVRLAVVTNNRTALQLYRRLGFTEYGFEERCLKDGDRYFNCVLMTKTLD